jgi:hypothetical protein
MLRSIAQQCVSKHVAPPSFETRFALLRMRAQQSRSRDAICIRVIVHAVRNVPQTDGRRSFCLPSNKGGGAPNGAPPVAAPDARAQPRPYASRSPFGAPPRLCAEIFRSQLGLGRASWNRRMQTGGPSPTPVQQAPCSPITRRTGRCPSRLKAEVTKPLPSGTAPAPSVASPVDVPHNERDGSIPSRL